MHVKIANFCKIPYTLHPEIIITHIVEKIPEKFLIGLTEVRLFDSRPSKTLRKNCVCKTLPSQYSIIEIYMDDPLLEKKIPFFSLLLLNTIFLGAINEHVINYLQPQSEDEEILAYSKRPGKINLKWGYFGMWSPLLSVFRIGSYLTLRVQIIQHIWLRVTKQFIEKHK